MPNLLPFVNVLNKSPESFRLCNKSYTGNGAFILVNLCLVCTSSFYRTEYIIYSAVYINISLIGLQAIFRSNKAKHVVTESSLNKDDYRLPVVDTMASADSTKGGAGITMGSASVTKHFYNETMTGDTVSLACYTVSMTACNQTMHFVTDTVPVDRQSGHFKTASTFKRRKWKELQYHSLLFLTATISGIQRDATLYKLLIPKN